MVTVAAFVTFIFMFHAFKKSAGGTVLYRKTEVTILKFFDDQIFIPAPSLFNRLIHCSLSSSTHRDSSSHCRVSLDIFDANFQRGTIFKTTVHQVLEGVPGRLVDDKRRVGSGFDVERPCALHAYSGTAFQFGGHYNYQSIVTAEKIREKQHNSVHFISLNLIDMIRVDCV